MWSILMLLDMADTNMGGGDVTSIKKCSDEQGGLSRSEWNNRKCYRRKSLQSCVAFHEKYGGFQASAEDDPRCSNDLENASAQVLRRASVSSDGCQTKISDKAHFIGLDPSYCPEVCAPGTEWLTRVAVASCVTIWFSCIGWWIYVGTALMRVHRKLRARTSASSTRSGSISG